MQEMMAEFPRTGRVEWIGLRPERKEPLTVVEQVEALENRGLQGDRAAEKSSGNRQVTFIQAEYLDATASMLGRDGIDPGLTRRNIVVRGLNLQALKGRRFRVGEAEFELAEECHPCSRMEENLGPGGYNAMRGHGGWCAIVVKGGPVKVGDAVTALEIVQTSKGL